MGIPLDVTPYLDPDGVLKVGALQLALAFQGYRNLNIFSERQGLSRLQLAYATAPNGRRTAFVLSRLAPTPLQQRSNVV